MSDVAVFHLDKDNVVRFSLRDMTKTLTGPEQAVQLLAKTLLTEPGSCAWAPSDGGGVRDLLSKGIQSVEATRIDAAITLRRTMESIRRLQPSSLASTARIVNLELLDATPVPSEAKIKLKIRIVLMSGNSFSVNFSLGVQ